MSNAKESYKLSAEEAAKVKERATLKALSPEEVKTFPPAGDGFSYCQNGKCYVACGSTWYQFVDANGNQFTCSSGRGKLFECGKSTYRCNC